MGLSIDLRAKGDISYFRRHLLAIIDNPAVDRILLCSGYIQENMWKYSILNDELLNHLSNHRNFPNIDLIVIAGKFNNGLWESAYKKFIRKLLKNNIKVHPYIAKRKNWHAKVAITLRGDKPLAAIIGSSNLTRPAFGEPYNKFNFECDVVIWSDTNDFKNYMYDKSFKKFDENGAEDPFSPIWAILDPDIKQLNEEKRLYKLYHLIMNEKELEPYKWEE